eukprot:g79766.t1
MEEKDLNVVIYVALGLMALCAAVCVGGGVLRNRRAVLPKPSSFKCDIHEIEIGPNKCGEGRSDVSQWLLSKSTCKSVSVHERAIRTAKKEIPQTQFGRRWKVFFRSRAASAESCNLNLSTGSFDVGEGATGIIYKPKRKSGWRCIGSMVSGSIRQSHRTHRQSAACGACIIPTSSTFDMETTRRTQSARSLPPSTRVVSSQTRRRRTGSNAASCTIRCTPHAEWRR